MRSKASAARPRPSRRGKFADEIVPLTTKMKKIDKATKEE